MCFKYPAACLQPKQHNQVGSLVWSFCAQSTVPPLCSSVKKMIKSMLFCKSKISDKFGRCGIQNMLRPYLKIWDWDLIFGRAVKAISSPGVRSLCLKLSGDFPGKFGNFQTSEKRKLSCSESRGPIKILIHVYVLYM